MANNTTALQESDLAFLRRAITFTVFGIVQFFAVIGNALTVFVIYRERRFKTNYYFLVFHLAICDLVLLTSIAISLAISFGFVTGSHPAINTTCKVIHCLLAYIGWCEMYLIMAIAALRYRAIVYPFRPPLNRVNMNCLVIAAHGVAFLLQSPYAFFVAETKEPRNICVKYLKNVAHLQLFTIYQYAILVLVFVVPMLVISFLYAKICSALLRHHKFMAARTTTTAEHEARLANTRHARNAKSMITSAIVMTLFVLGMLPTRVTTLVIARGGITVNPVHIFWIGALRMLCTCAINPIVYGIADKALYSAYKKTFMKIRNLCR